VAYFILLAGIAATIFYLFVQERENAIDVLFLTLYASVTALFFLRLLFYLRYKATLNEVYFFSLSNLIPLGIFMLEPLVPMGRNSLVSFLVIGQGDIPLPQGLSLRITILSILALPYLVLSTALLIRSFTRYQFIRLSAQSERGPSAELTAILTFFVFSFLFLAGGIFASDLLGLFYGLFYLTSGTGFLFSR